MESALAFDPRGLAARSIRARGRRRRASRHLGQILVFFSLSISKLATYAAGAAALDVFVARTLLWGIERGRAVGLTRAAWTLLVGGPILGLVAAILPFVSDHYRVPIVVPYLFAGAALLVVCGFVTLRQLAAQRPYAALVAFAASWMVVLTLAIGGRGIANEYSDLARRAWRDAPRRSARALPELRPEHGLQQRRTLGDGGQPGEMTFGSQQGDQSAWFWSNDEFLRQWSGPGRMLVLFNRNHIGRLGGKLDPPPIVLATKDKKVLAANRESSPHGGYRPAVVESALMWIR